jgi:thioredoxin reductase (NADPH)
MGTDGYITSDPIRYNSPVTRMCTRTEWSDTRQILSSPNCCDHRQNPPLVVREHDLGESMSRYLADRIMRNPAIEVCLHSEVRELIGDEALETLVIEDTETGALRRLDARALFVFIGAQPHTEWLKGRVALDAGGYVLTGQDAVSAATDDGRDDARRSPTLLETNVPGVFAAGDVRSGSTQRVAAAVGDGAITVRLVHQFLGGRRQAVRLAQTYVSAASA